MERESCSKYKKSKSVVNSMKFQIIKILIVLGLSLIFIINCSETSKINVDNLKPKKSFYDLEAKDINGNTISMSIFKNKKVLIVNVASNCGYTSQYKNLQTLYEEYKDSLYILAFPSNDFLNQEPGSNEEIRIFCEINFGIRFDIFEKISVKGKHTHPIYKWLSNEYYNGWNTQSPEWNFSKYLINENGLLLGFWGPSIDPLSNQITDELK